VGRRFKLHTEEVAHAQSLQETEESKAEAGGARGAREAGLRSEGDLETRASKQETAGGETGRARTSQRRGRGKGEAKGARKEKGPIHTQRENSLSSWADCFDQ
jgi:hypothetical protein